MMLFPFIFCIIIFLQFQNIYGFSIIPKKQISLSNWKNKIDKKLNPSFSVINSSLNDNSLECQRSNIVIEKTISPKSSFATLFARFLGYVVAAGAMFIYSPILIKLISKGNADGFSLYTWVFNIIGLTLALSYPVKKGFPISTYLEILLAGTQSVTILALISYYQGHLISYFIGLSVLVISFFSFQKIPNVDPKLLNMVQIFATLFANYANIPQILLTFKLKKSSWSPISASLSVIGCLIRIFTSIQLTKDPILIGGYTLGLLTNSLLLCQIFLYP